MNESEESENQQEQDLPLNFFLLENNPYIKFIFGFNSHPDELQRMNEIVLNLSPSITFTFSCAFMRNYLEIKKIRRQMFFLQNAKVLNKNYTEIHVKKTDDSEVIIKKVLDQNEIFVKDFVTDSKYKSLLPNLGDFQPFFDYLYDLTQTRRQRLFLKLNEKKSYVLYSLAFYKSQSNKNETIYLTLSDLPSIKEPVKQEIVKLNTVYYALNGIRFNTDNKFISTILTEDSLLSIIELNEEDPLTNLKIKKIDPVLFVLKVEPPQPSRKSTRNLKKTTRSFGGGLKLKKRLKSKSPKKINRKKSLKKKSKKMKR
jgi:hypothetical protein